MKSSTPRLTSLLRVSSTVTSIPPFSSVRGLGDNTPLPVYLHERIYPMEAALSEEEAYVSAVCALIESVRHGATCLCDPGSQRPEATVRAVHDVGSRAVVSRSLTDMAGGRNLPGTFDSTAREAAAAGEAFVKSLAGSEDGRIRAWFSAAHRAHGF